MAALSEETGDFDVRLWLAMSVSRSLPPLIGNRSRTGMLRFAGVAIGLGTTFGGAVSISGARIDGSRAAKRLTVGKRCWINTECMFDLSASITIGDDVALGQGVALITNTHEIAGPEGRAGSLRREPIVIGSGTWLGTRSTVLPGVVIGSGCIVAAGSMVTKSVEQNTLVAGVPAKVVRRLDG